MDTLAARDEAVIQFLTAHIGKPTPLNREIAAHLGASIGTTDASLRRLDKAGRISNTGYGNTRLFHINGAGSTIPRWGKVREAAEIVEPVRVLDSFPCAKCGTARGCGCYTARLTSAARLPVWGIA